MLSSLDISIVVLYALGLFVIAQWVSREKSGHQKNTQDCAFGRILSVRREAALPLRLYWNMYVSFLPLVCVSLSW
jgi:hypothetical protein